MDPVAIPAEVPEDALRPPFDEEAFRRAHVYEVGGQVVFTVAGVVSAVSVVSTAICVTAYSVTWQDECLWPARIAVGSTGLALAGGGAAIYGSYGEAQALRVPWTEGTIGVVSLGLSLPMFGFGGYYLVENDARAVPYALVGLGLADLGLASTACQVRYGHREARRHRLLGGPSMRLRNDFVFCGLLDAFTMAVSPVEGALAPTAVFRTRF